LSSPVDLAGLFFVPQFLFLAYCVEKLAFSRKLVNSNNLKSAKLLFLLGRVPAETLEIR
jgi:hypothetical protein